MLQSHAHTIIHNNQTQSYTYLYNE